MIEIQQLVKRYGDKTAVDCLDFTVKPGVVTGFLGPNGAGKSTTMRLIVGLDAPTSGRALVNGKAYAKHASPLQEIGSLLEAKSVHPGMTAFAHLRALALTHGISRRRVDDVIELAGLTAVAHKKVGGFSLGMGQRLGVASALLGDPQIVVLDEPVNGLDPEGVLWIRHLLRGLADEGRTVLISSHLMGEMALTATNLIIIGRGRLLADTTVSEFVAQADEGIVTVTCSDPGRLREMIAIPGVTVTGEPGSQDLTVRGLPARSIGEAAARNGITLHALIPQSASLEEAFMALTEDSVDYHAGPPVAASTRSHP
ncbi:ABC transporter ATP-binding protein [Streptomyces sp. NPDC056244]|uniref:ABC transporter ATP-binding protein n=1 Tax=Streptomyces sp. NPDC056244 TaxID=3345762 RepID=UPI0035E2245E